MSGIALLLIASASVGLSVTATPPALNSSADGSPFTTAAVTAIPAGGTGTYTYEWTVGDVPAFGTFTFNSITSASTTIEIDSFVSGDLVLGSVICTVTDTVTMETAEVEVTIRHRDRGIPA